MREVPLQLHAQPLLGMLPSLLSPSAIALCDRSLAPLLDCLIILSPLFEHHTVCLSDSFQLKSWS